MNDNKNSFLDSNTILAILLSFLFFFFWQMYSEKTDNKIDNIQTSKSSEEKVDKITEKVLVENLNYKDQPEQTLSFDLPNVSGVISSRGFGFKKIILKRYKDRKNNEVSYFTEGIEANYATLLDNKAPTFTLELIDPSKIFGKVVLPEGKIEKTIKINSEDYFADIEIVFFPNNSSEKTIEVKTKINQILEKIESSLLKPSYDVNEFYVLNSDGEQRETIQYETNSLQNFKSVKLGALSSHYFTLGLFDQSDILSVVSTNFDVGKLVGSIEFIHPTIEKKEKYVFKYKAYFGPKKFDILNKIDSSMIGIINYGFFGFFGKFLLAILVWIQKIVKNWGLAVIGLTLVVRFLLLPIMISSYKSMRKMQKIQPQLKLIREKYKEDPQKMNLETMQLMKREKANPVSGCLPMLLQIPIFFALYQVIGNSIELYQSPFIFWIKDLSLMDPFYVLPLLVGVMFFIQQKISPQPTDPAQAKMMMFMPFLFTFFMISVPSGLNLYILVSTVFGIVQQLFFMKEKTA